MIDAVPSGEDKLIVLTAPLTETIDHAGYFIQMALASMPGLMEAAIDQKYPKWREVECNPDGSARYMPAGVRLLEASLLREFPAGDLVCCYPDKLSRFIGPRTRVVGVSTHNPLGVTFAAGVYASVFGSSREPINAHYAKRMFRALQENPHRSTFQVIVGGPGGWQVCQTDSYRELGVDCVVEGRSESEQVLQLFHRAIRGEPLPRFVEVRHPESREALLTPAKRTTFGVVEMTTGCGRRCQFCLPDLNPQLDFPKDRIMDAVRANVREGNGLISLATEDLFLWGQVRTSTPFYFPNREALVDLFTDVATAPGVNQHVLSHGTMAPAVVDPKLIEQLSAVLLDKSTLFLWLWKLRKTNGPAFTWPLLMFTNLFPEWIMEKMGKIYRGRPLEIKSRKELLASIKPQHWKYLRADNGDLPDGWSAAAGANPPLHVIQPDPGCS